MIFTDPDLKPGDWLLLPDWPKWKGEPAIVLSKRDMDSSYVVISPISGREIRLVWIQLKMIKASPHDFHFMRNT